MKIKYNEIEKAIEIKDGVKMHHLAIKIVFGLNLFNAILNLFGLDKTGFGYMSLIWLVIGVTSLIILYIFM